MVFFVLVPMCYAINANEAINGVGRAERNLGSVFTAVADAAAFGANVTEMLNKLDIAASFLSEAHAAFKKGDYESALEKAVNCESALSGLEYQAASLKAEAERKNSDRVFMNVFSSFVGLALVLVLGFLGWRFLKRWYLKHLLSMKSEKEARV